MMSLYYKRLIINIIIDDDPTKALFLLFYDTQTNPLGISHSIRLAAGVCPYTGCSHHISLHIEYQL